MQSYAEYQQARVRRLAARLQIASGLLLVALGWWFYPAALMSVRPDWEVFTLMPVVDAPGSRYLAADGLRPAAVPVAPTKTTVQQAVTALPVAVDPTPIPLVVPSAFAAGDRPALRRDPHSYDLRGPPSISVATIERVLRSYNSPAIGQGPTIYDIGRQYNIDPVFLLAQYVHESSAGTAGVAANLATLGFGNIRCPVGLDYLSRPYQCYGPEQTHNGWFAYYRNWTDSANHYYGLISGPLYCGAELCTPAAIMSRYAPGADNNDEQGYVKTVERLVDEWRAEEQFFADSL